MELFQSLLFRLASGCTPGPGSSLFPQLLAVDVGLVGLSGPLLLAFDRPRSLLQLLYQVQGGLDSVHDDSSLRHPLVCLVGRPVCLSLLAGVGIGHHELTPLSSAELDMQLLKLLPGAVEGVYPILDGVGVVSSETDPHTVEHEALEAPDLL